MTRSLLLALALLAAIPSAPAHAQPATEICGGHFERYLKGFTIDKSELDHFLRNDAAIADCRAQLDPANDQHRLIDAFILWRKSAPDAEVSLRLFDEACAKGSDFGCFYAVYGPERGQTDRKDDRIQRAHRAFVAEFPAASFLRGWIITQGGGPSTATKEDGMNLIRRASDAGDYHATELLAIVASIEGGEPGLQAMLALLRKAAEQGHVPSLNKLAEHRIARNDDHAGAIALFRRAATADPRWFREDIAWAQYRLGILLRDGERTTRDPAEAQRWLQSSAALGNTAARDELEKMK